MIPLCIDCDGTLVRSDLFIEALVRVLLRKPWFILILPFWLFQGRHVLKYKVAELCDIDVSNIPLRQEVLEYALAEKSRGARLYLVTAACERHARQIAEHLDFFDEIFHSTSEKNLKGETKAAMLAEKFGKGGFSYIGDSHADLPVWKEAGSAIVVGGSSDFFASVQRINPKSTHLSPKKTTLKDWLKLIRVHQWAKNLIIFVPLVTAHQFFNPSYLAASLAAFFSLSFVASATYILNDLIDLDHDRAHKTKKHRPLASGAVVIPSGVALGVLIFVAGVLIAAFLPITFWLCLAIYVAATLSYSFYLKKVALIDAILLAGLYTLRLLIGHAATGVPISVWLLAFSIFLFFSLALVKRFVEISESKAIAVHSAPIRGRGYCAEDYWLVGALGVACGALSVLVLILYVNSPEVRILYSSPILLMLLAPIFLYWIGRVWLLAARGRMNEDPVLFALRDKASYAVGLATIMVIFFASGSK